MEIRLTEREREVATSLAQGHTRNEAVDLTGLSQSTLARTLSDIYRKTGTFTTTSALVVLASEGVITTADVTGRYATGVEPRPGDVLESGDEFLLDGVRTLVEGTGRSYLYFRCPDLECGCSAATAYTNMHRVSRRSHRVAAVTA